MNILYISYDGALDPLGSSQIIPYLTELSAKDKVRFTLLTYEKKEMLRDKEKVCVLKKQLAEKNINWQFLRYHKSPAVPATVFDIIMGTIKVFVLYFREGVCLIHARSFIGAIPALILSIATKTKFIFDMRGLWPDEKVDAGAWKKNGALYKVVKRIEHCLLSRADRVIVLSERGKRLIENSFNLRGEVSVIPTCTDLNVFNILPRYTSPAEIRGEEGRFTFIYLGSIGSWYMFDEMVDFFAASKQFFNSPLFVLLTNADTQVIKSALAYKEVDSGDYIVSSTEHGKVCRWMAAADVSVSFIKPLYSKIVSCPTKFGESLACGVPVVINSGIGDTADIVRNEGIGAVVEEFSPEAYFGALEWLKDNLGHKDMLRQRCRLAAEKYLSLSKGVDSYLKVYSSLSGD